MPDSTPIRNVITLAGRTILSDLVAGDRIVFAYVKVGNGTDWKDEEEADLAEHTDINRSMGIVGGISRRRVDDNVVTLSAQFTNSGLESAGYVTEIGVFARLESQQAGEEIMFSYMNFGDFPDLLLGESQASVQRVYDVPFIFDGAAAITINISPSAIITEENTIIESLPASSDNSGKVPRLDENGKLEVDITGDANTLDGHDSTYFATADHDHSDAYVGENSSYHGFMSVADKTSMITMTSQINNSGTVQNVTTAATPTFVGLNLNGGYINGARFS